MSMRGKIRKIEDGEDFPIFDQLVGGIRSEMKLKWDYPEISTYEVEETDHFFGCVSDEPRGTFR